jgi:hypothetical protein
MSSSEQHIHIEECTDEQPTQGSSSSSASSTSSAHTQQQQPAQMYTLIRRIFSNTNIVDILSDLVATLEHIKYEHRPTGKKIFETDWSKQLFFASLDEDMKKNFDIEQWYAIIVSKSPAPLTDDFGGIMDPSLYNAQIKTDWVTPLMHLESISSGFIPTLHGILSLEKQAQMKMNQFMKLGCNAQLYGLSEKQRVFEQQQTSSSTQQQQQQNATTNFGGFIKYT